MSLGSLDPAGFSTTTDHVVTPAPGPFTVPPPPPNLQPEGPPVEMPVDSQVLVDPRGPRLVERGHPAFPRPPKKRRRWVRWVVVGLIVAAIVGAGLTFGLPAIHTALTTESTDDAFVSAHITNVSPRIDDVVTEVLVDQNDRVEPGTLLVRLDREPFEIAVAQSQAALEEARSQLALARTQARAQLASARGSWFRRKNTQEQLRRQVASLRAQVATLRANQSSQELAELDQRRIANLVRQGSATQSELDQRNNTLRVAQERVKEAWADINETRAALGLGPNTEDPLDIPANLETEQSTVQTAVSDIAATLSQLGIYVGEKDISEARAFDKIMKLDLSGGENHAFDRLIDRAPGIQVARAGVVRAEKALEDAKLRLSYTEIRSEIAGFVQDRSANPGNRVSPGETLLSIRPDYVWIAANFKETQIHHLRIGHPVDLYVDAYPDKVFKGRVAGFSPGTGLSESLLPPENATGNYVKVTQRLPVRIELDGPNPTDTPLFAGLSVVPYVHIDAQPTGPEAGRRLHERGLTTPPDVGGGPAGSRPENRGTEIRGDRP
jgi:membrane fusion protein (multidrug efflux system)